MSPASPRRAAAQIQLSGITAIRGGRRVLDAVDLVVAPGERVGLIGANGAGKSTLLAIAAGALAPDAGETAGPTAVGLLAQELPPAPGRSVGGVVDAAVAPVLALSDRLEAAAAALADSPAGEAADDYDRALAAAEHAGLWSLDARIATVLAGLGLADLPRDLPLDRLSGGRRRRLALAALLLERPEALLLDEPTNHLDDEAVEFVVGELAAWRGPVLIASHDRAFLDEAVTAVVDLDPATGPHGVRDGVRQGRRTTGGFSAYLEQRERDLGAWRAAHLAEQTERERLARVIAVEARTVFRTSEPRGEGRIAKKFEADRAAKTIGGRLRQARAALAALDRTPVAPPPESLRFRGFAAVARPAPEDVAGPPRADADDERPAARSPDEPLAALDAVAVDDRLAATTLVIAPRDRILVEGPNGAGKSTLLALLAGALAPDSGRIAVRGRVARLTQDDEWADLDPPASEAHGAALRSAGLDPDAAPTLAELGLLDPAAAALPLRALSYGQRRRVALGALVAAPPELLLLDEPTNHLALELAEALERALPDFPGAVVVASHDRWLRRRWQGRRVRLGPSG